MQLTNLDEQMETNTLQISNCLRLKHILDSKKSVCLASFQVSIRLLLNDELRNIFYSEYYEINKLL